MSPLGLLNLHVLCMQGHVCNLTKVKKNSTFISCQASEQSQPENLVASDHSCSSFRGTWTKWNTITKDWLCYSRETQKCLPERNSRMWLANRECWGEKKNNHKASKQRGRPSKRKKRLHKHEVRRHTSPRQREELPPNLLLHSGKALSSSTSQNVLYLHPNK